MYAELILRPRMVFISCPDHKGTVTSITTYIKQPTFPALVQQFLYYQLLSSGSRPNADTSDLETLRVRGLPISNKKVSLYTSASSIFFAPSDPCGIHGFHREQIQSTWSWRGGSSQHDMVLVNMGDGGNKDLPMSGYAVAQVLLFFSLEHSGDKFPAALVWQYTLSDDSACRDEATVHLLPYFGWEPVQKHLSYTDTLDSFANLYVLPNATTDLESDVPLHTHASCATTVPPPLHETEYVSSLARETSRSMSRTCCSLLLQPSQISPTLSTSITLLQTQCALASDDLRRKGLESEAKSAGCGQWNPHGPKICKDSSTSGRDNSSTGYSKFLAIVESVRDGTTLQVQLLMPEGEHQFVNVTPPLALVRLGHERAFTT
ncbi:hypothetical protein EDB92DRAFT_1821978 [Lactarius akahatsu]|uniref:Uncharacterized protein n=1 Tax=Lactarius akahatsu TaxID=416441 RepID=A0AAD4L7H6_9AGAM|nr:hypothetical protein EDB92DRAFT_1821978 [Lactarius akahatsu]